MVRAVVVLQEGNQCVQEVVRTQQNQLLQNVCRRSRTNREPQCYYTTLHVTVILPGKHQSSQTHQNLTRSNTLHWILIISVRTRSCCSSAASCGRVFPLKQFCTKHYNHRSPESTQWTFSGGDSSRRITFYLRGFSNRVFFLQGFSFLRVQRHMISTDYPGRHFGALVGCRSSVRWEACGRSRFSPATESEPASHLGHQRTRTSVLNKLRHWANTHINGWIDSFTFAL